MRLEFFQDAENIGLAVSGVENNNRGWFAIDIEHAGDSLLGLGQIAGFAADKRRQRIEIVHILEFHPHAGFVFQPKIIALADGQNFGMIFVDIGHQFRQIGGR